MDFSSRWISARTVASVTWLRMLERQGWPDAGRVAVIALLGTGSTQPLSMLLPDRQRDYLFMPAKPERISGRWAHVVQYRVTTPMSVSVEEIPGKDDCISFNIEGGTRGRIWIDPDTFQVLRLDQALIGLVDIPLPRRAASRSGGDLRWTLERHDISIRFKPVRFSEPEETLLLPVSSTALRITRGSGQPRLRTSIDYTNYRRFLTGARVIGDER